MIASNFGVGEVIASKPGTTPTAAVRWEHQQWKNYDKNGQSSLGSNTKQYHQ